MGRTNPTVSLNVVYFDNIAAGPKEISVIPTLYTEYILFDVTWPTNNEVSAIVTNRVQNSARLRRCNILTDSCTDVKTLILAQKHAFLLSFFRKVRLKRLTVGWIWQPQFIIQMGMVISFCCRNKRLMTRTNIWCILHPMAMSRDWHMERELLVESMDGMKTVILCKCGLVSAKVKLEHDLRKCANGWWRKFNVCLTGVIEIM